ncbi:MAG: hypothetical protein GX436_02215 [Synergistaceae bacterium]|nr:hypothetical protein [Synergistaceae bacterium]
MQGTRKRVLTIAWLLAVFAVIAGSRTAFAHTRVLSVPGYPIYLVLREEAGVVSQAVLRTPAGIQPVTEIVGFSLTGEISSTLKVDRDSKPDLIWKLSFVNWNDRSQGTVLWISLLSRQPRLWLAVSPIGETLWDAIRPRLSVPRGILLYVSPALPAFFRLPEYQGKEILTYVYCIQLGETGPVLTNAPEVYKQLLRIVQTVREHEVDLGRKKAYEALESDFKALSEGGKPSAEAILNFNFRKIAELSWKP